MGRSVRKGMCSLILLKSYGQSLPHSEFIWSFFFLWFGSQRIGHSKLFLEVPFEFISVFLRSTSTTVMRKKIRTFFFPIRVYLCICRAWINLGWGVLVELFGFYLFVGSEVLMGALIEKRKQYLVIILYVDRNENFVYSGISKIVLMLTLLSDLR